MKNTSKTYNWLVIATVCIVTLLFVLGYRFVLQARESLYEEKINYMEEISLKSAKNIQDQIKGDFSTLSAISTFIGGHVTFDVEHYLPILKQEANNNSFKRMGIILPDGTTITTDGIIMDLSGRDYFEKAINGSSVVSDCLIDKADGEEINVFASPIYHKAIVAGVVFATKTQQQFSEAKSIGSFNGEGYSYIITSDGRPVVKTSHPESIGDYKNIFEEFNSHGVEGELLKNLKSDIEKGINGTVEYRRNGERRQLCYARIGISDWYLLSVVPSDAISIQSDQLVRNLTILTVMITLVVSTASFWMIIVLRRNNMKLEKIAYTDNITGYNNWVKFKKVAKEILINNPKQKFTMIIFDINKFKVINDLFGHENGDQVLRFVAQILSENTGELETFARISSDNFNLLIKYESDENVIKRVEKISNSIEGYIENYKIELSVGIYPITDSIININVLSDRASISKNIAKKQNDVNYHFFKEENRIEIINEKEIENMMESALNDGEFEVYLQPKYLLETGEIIGAEALVRWNRRGVGLISPNNFIPLFEKNGFIRKLDLYMFESVCKFIQRWDNEFHRKFNLPISVNISRVHLSNKNLPQDLISIANKYEIAYDLLEIELTESAVFTDVKNMIEIMRKIKEKGFWLSIDDFGSGYSSLSALKDLPADIVKIDKSFLHETVNDKRGKKMIESIITMSKGLGLRTIAEGIETEEQMEILKAAGCDMGQGYFYARPMPAEEFKKLIISEENLI